MAQRILFLSHSASRNGASLLLLHFLRWLKLNTRYSLDVLCTGDGPLVKEYREVARTRILRNPLRAMRVLPTRWSAPLATALQARYLQALVRQGRYDVVYANTAAAWPQIAAIGQLGSAGCPVLWHIHELSYALHLLAGSAQGRSTFSNAARWVAVSNAVAEVLSKDFQVDPDLVDMVHGFVPQRDWADADRQARRLQVLSRLGWPEDSFVVGGCGGTGWRKGSDVFLQIAHAACSSERKLRFLWVGGGNAQDQEGLQWQHDLQGLQLESHCQRVPSTADVDDYYCAMDMFALTSREDPFPLVMLEAAMHALPTVCFDTAGGGADFVAGRAGLTVSYLDQTAFAQAILQLHRQPAWLRQLGQTARAKVLREHCVESQGPKLVRSIERCLQAA